MTTRIALWTVLTAALVLSGMQSASARAQSLDHGGTYFGDVTVDSNEVVDGDLTVIAGDATIDGTVRGDLTVIMGNATISGTVGDVDVVGGTVFQRPGAAIGGISALDGGMARSVIPWTPPPNDFFFGDSRVLWSLVWDVVALLVFLIFPVRVRAALGRLEEHPGLCSVIGLIGWLAVIPIGVLLFCLVLTWPLIPVEFIALVAGVFIGKAALSLLVGRRLYELLNPRSTPSPLGALILGLALITAAELVPIIGHLVTGLVWIVGVGAAILTLFNDRTLGTTTIARPTISGPPMTTA